ncbi:uncharacterized protein LOC109815968 isoform X2 [Cajanus cajan]|uniref:uncharacterized protein LOC109815968 isoform X2 n=1 Tax=Cajanus cajan TaxID=3821 RepID=UPI00098DCAE6|nr:uncharacterized protein LOC109815968 isoform X2 [Cajanus cajan]
MQSEIQASEGSARMQQMKFWHVSHDDTMQHQQQRKEDINAELCDICGDRGFPETIVTCSKCHVNREHCYCMRINTLEIPEYWLCESCQSKGVSNSPPRVNQDIGQWASKMQRAVRTRKVKFLHEDEVIKLSSGKAFVGSKNVISKIPSLPPKPNPPISSPKLLGKLPRNDEVQKKRMTNQHASCSLTKGPPKEFIGKIQLPMGGVVPDKKLQTHDLQKEKPTKRAPFEALSTIKSPLIVGSGGIRVVDAECNKSNTEKIDPKSVKEILNLDHKFLPSYPTWKGQFQILQTAASGEVFDGFEARPPCIVNRKAYEFSKEMPSVLQLKSLPALNVMTDIFQDDSPKLQDIALYIFPSDNTERSRKNMNTILKFMNDQKSMLRSYINGVELLVFTSNQLDMNTSGVIAAVNAGHFLWGIFRHSKIDKAIGNAPDMEPVDMDIDMIGGKDVVGRVDHIRNDKPKSVPLMDVPPGFDALV